jgi:hypothetical protein
MPISLSTDKNATGRRNKASNYQTVRTLVGGSATLFELRDLFFFYFRAAPNKAYACSSGKLVGKIGLGLELRPGRCTDGVFNSKDLAVIYRCHCCRF